MLPTEQFIHIFLINLQRLIYGSQYFILCTSELCFSGLIYTALNSLIDVIDVCEDRVLTKKFNTNVYCRSLLSRGSSICCSRCCSCSRSSRRLRAARRRRSGRLRRLLPVHRAAALLRAQAQQRHGTVASPALLIDNWLFLKRLGTKSIKFSS